MKRSKEWAQGRCKLCHRNSYSRGVCLMHYTSFRRLVKREVTTWELLENANLILPSNRKFSFFEGLKEFLTR